MESLTVSVIIPTYNNGLFIRFALDSVLKQTYPRDKIEIIVIDDGSTDNTYDVIKDYIEQIVYVYQEHSGIAAARNKGIDLSKGEIITFLDSDDVWLKDRIGRVVDKFKEDDRIGIVYHPVEMIDKDGRIICKNFNIAFGYVSKAEGWITNDIISGKIFCGGSAFSFKREVLQKVYPVPIDIIRGVDFYLTSVSACFTQAGYIPEVLGKYRMHNNNISFMTGMNNCKELAVLNKDFALMRQKTIEKISSLNIEIIHAVDLNKIKRMQSKELIFFNILNGKRLKGIKLIPSLFKGNASIKDLLKGLAVSFMAICMPRYLFFQIVKSFGLFIRFRRARYKSPNDKKSLEKQV